MSRPRRSRGEGRRGSQSCWRSGDAKWPLVRQSVHRAAKARGVWWAHHRLRPPGRMMQERVDLPVVGRAFPPPSIFGQDLKAGTGGGEEPIAEIAKAIYNSRRQSSRPWSRQSRLRMTPTTSQRYGEGSWQDVGGAGFLVESLWSVHCWGRRT